MRKTMRKVMMVVPVLITSCQVSEKWNTGPVAAHMMMMMMPRPDREGPWQTDEFRRPLCKTAKTNSHSNSSLHIGVGYLEHIDASDEEALSSTTAL
jgi:hypothetical protein